MFSKLNALADDPILGLSQLFKADDRAEKVDLGVGVFRTQDGRTPIMEAVKKAERRVVDFETTKAYTPPAGAPGFNEAILKLVCGEDSRALKAGRCAAIQTPGGCGALRIAGELLKRAKARAISVGTPTWPNHIPLLTAAGLKINSVPYYNVKDGVIEFDAFRAAVSALERKDVLLLHGPCHNPTGADPSREQISAIYDLAVKRGFLVLIDSAYHGFAKDLEADAFIIREAIRRLPEALITYSCSKNFGLYRERTGALILIGENADRASALRSHAVNLARANYSMPPAHGGAIVAEILQSDELSALWRAELAEMTAAMRASRRLLVSATKAVGLGNRLAYVAEQNGMFSLLPMTEERVAAARERFGVYIVGAGRINLCGVNETNADYIARALKEVMRD